jgi:TPR repeat protein
MADHSDFYRSLPTTPFDAPPRPSFSSHSDGPSPPQTGTVPPALSPLDAFAFQGRLLAKKFEEESRNGKRLSRLPPLTIQHEFGKPRPAFLRSASDTYSPTESSPDDVTPRSAKEVKPDRRPMSMHPTIGGEPVPGFARNSLFLNALTSVEEDEQEAAGYFPFPRSHSPEAFEAAHLESANRFHPDAARATQESPTPSLSLPVRARAPPNLAAPSSLRSLGGSPSIRSVLEGNSEDVDNLSLNNSVDGYSIPRAPVSPFVSVPRSPSMASERSVSSVTGLPRPSFNYSRPLSRARGPSFDFKRPFESPFRQDSGATSSSRPSLDVPFKHDSTDSPLTPLTNDAPQTPVSISSDEFFTFNAPAADAPSSYIYAKYSIPKGNKRESIGAEEFFNRHINWNSSTINTDPILETPFSVGPVALPSPTLTDSPPKNRRRERPADIAIPRKFSEETQSSPRRRTHKSRPSSPSTMTSDASTIKARLARSKQSSNEITPEMHLSKGVDCHQAGSLQESTYHFRLAAKAGLADAMLLYALACRHGWGMRPNPAEAVTWLQKAVDSAQLEVAEDESTTSQGKSSDAMDRAAHKAQFALGVYELGMSYMKGWGVQQDRALGLRCFEVAGNWGDTDALIEAGLCYTEGIGCKKDKAKAAKFYRIAEAKGTTLAGNSWYVYIFFPTSDPRTNSIERIHKDKYKDDEKNAERMGRPSRIDTTDSNSSIKKRDKSRTRNFFARKKSTAS